MAKDQADKQTNDAFPVHLYIASCKYIHENGQIRSGQIGVQAANIDEATVAAHKLAKESWDKYKITSIKLW